MRGGWNQKEKRRMLETKVVSNGVGCVHVDPSGEGRHERGASENIPEGKAKRQEKKVKKLTAPKRKTIRVESEETHDYVREANDMDQDMKLKK